MSYNPTSNPTPIPRRPIPPPPTTRGTTDRPPPGGGESSIGSIPPNLTGRSGPAGKQAVGAASRSSSERRARPSPAESPAYPYAGLTVRAWIDPVVDNLGHDPRSPYVERFWLAVLGPSCLLLLRRLAHRLERHPDGFDLACREWAAELGLGMKGGKHGPFWRAVERACRFRAAQRNGDMLVVRRRLPPLSSRQVERLPTHLRDQHRIWLDEQLARPRRGTLGMWNPDRSSAA